VVAAVAVAVFGVLIAGGGGSSHSVYAVVPEAAAVVPGLEVRAAGVRVGSTGEIVPVDGGRAAKVEFKLDDRAWPLRGGSIFQLRWGGTGSFSARYLNLDPSTDGPKLADGATLPKGSLQAPVEFDTFTAMFDRGVRSDLSHTLQNTGATLKDAVQPLRSALGSAPPVAEEANQIFRSLQENHDALHALLRSGDSVVNAIQGADPGLGLLLSGAGTTFAATASRAHELQVTLDRLQPTLEQMRSTLGHADGTLQAAADLTDRIGPGVSELRRLSHPLNRLLGSVVRVAPDARASLASVRAATPYLNPLLSRATSLMPTLESIGRRGVHELRCIRPYTPEIVSLASNWGDFFSYVDDKDKMARVAAANIYGGLNAAPLNADQASKTFPGLVYGFPRPPGMSADQPWFLPQCGAGPDALDPAKDPEARQ
jgi:ABC-type transporter Mla subunit MlaD